MTAKIYEYKDDANWFIGRWGGHHLMSCFGDMQDDRVLQLNQQLSAVFDSQPFSEESWLARQGYDILVLRLGEIKQLLCFAIDLIHQETGRELKVTEREGAVILTEGEQLLMVHLPEGGVPLSKVIKGDQDDR